MAPLQSGNTALRAATALGDADCICELLDHGANIDLETSRGTALLAASVQGDIDTLLLLLEKGATIDYETASGTYTPHVAITISLAMLFLEGTASEYMHKPFFRSKLRSAPNTETKHW